MIKRIFTGIAITALVLGTFMSIRNSINGHGILTNKTLHESVQAQLNGSSGDDTGTGTGTGTDTGGTGDVTKLPGAYLIAGNETKRLKTDESGTLHIPDIEEPYKGLKGNSYYNVTIHYGRCGLTLNMNSYCDLREAKTYIIGIILDKGSEGDGTGTGNGNNPQPPTP